ncbi:MAG: metallophosphoesterase family protein [Candidatus Pristimantibacillus sp.]
MKIVVVSDTHMPRMAKGLPERLVKELVTADLIIHAGDWTQSDVYDKLVKYAPVEGVAGNNDGDLLANRFGYKKIIKCGTKRFGIVHGHLPNPKRSAVYNASNSFTAEEVDVIIFGHSHVPLLKWHNGILLFNPGSTTSKRKQRLYSFGIIHAAEGVLKARHIYHESKD